MAFLARLLDWCGRSCHASLSVSGLSKEAQVAQGLEYHLLLVMAVAIATERPCPHGMLKEPLTVIALLPSDMHRKVCLTLTYP